MSDLFSSAPVRNEPLASRMRPRSLDEYIGQDHILGPGRLLRRAIQMDQLSSIIFYGPPGVGKTTLARVIANTTKSHFATINAVLSGVKELRDEISAASNRRDCYGMRTILFIDEVHRWNKSQQDALLPWVENGTFILIGATTENPFFEVNRALVSRSRVFQLKKLGEEDLKKIALQALCDRERGYGKYRVTFEEGALEHLVLVASGDARSLLNALELAVETTPQHFPPEEGSEIYISKETAEESIQKKVVLYDKEGDYHFDVISAFIKSIRGSDPDATLYWLARMVRAGEDPRFIFRRMIISAAEDIGLADPRAVEVVVADAEAFDRIGLPEGRFHLSHAAIYLSTCPKSNSTMGFFDALKAVEEEKEGEVPLHLRDDSRDSKAFGHGEGYLYPHSYTDHWVNQQYLPSSLQGRIFYKPGSLGYEKEIRSLVFERREAQIEASSSDFFLENYTYSPDTKERDKWIKRALSRRSEILSSLTESLYSSLLVRRHENVLVLNASNGLLLYPLMRLNPEGLSTAVVAAKEQKEIIEHFSSQMEELERPSVIVSSPYDSFSLIEKGMRFGVISGHNVLSRLECDKKILPLIKASLEEDGEMALLETIPSLSSRLSYFASDSLKKSLENAEMEIYSPDSPLFGWGKEKMEKCVREVFPESTVIYKEVEEERHISRENAESWYERTYSKYGVDKASFLSFFSSRNIKWKNTVAVIRSNTRKLREAGKNEHKAVETMTQ